MAPDHPASTARAAQRSERKRSPQAEEGHMGSSHRSPRGRLAHSPDSRADGRSLMRRIPRTVSRRRNRVSGGAVPARSQHGHSIPAPCSSGHLVTSTPLACMWPGLPPSGAAYHFRLRDITMNPAAPKPRARRSQGRGGGCSRTRPVRLPTLARPSASRPISRGCVDFMPLRQAPSATVRAAAP